jgi:hypothetical protein
MWNNAEQYRVEAPAVHTRRTEYLDWYSKMTVSLIHVPPPVADVVDPRPRLHFEPHGNESMLLVSVYFILFNLYV